MLQYWRLPLPFADAVVGQVTAEAFVPKLAKVPVAFDVVAAAVAAVAAGGVVAAAAAAAPGGVYG